MERRGALAVVAVVVLAVGVASAVAVVGTGALGFGDHGGASAQPPAMVSFTSAGARCTADFSPNSSTSVVAGGPNTRITYARNVSLPGPSYAVGRPTFERVNDSTYVLDVPIAETDKPTRACPGVARYNATVRLPAGEDPWRVLVRHDGERVTQFHGESNSSLLGGSARVGQRVSAPAPNATTTSD
ncbi:MAG: hypothetical protein ABEJ70_02115 [Halobacteriaceae archaeon]